MHATLVRHWTQPQTLLRSSWFTDLQAAETHAQAHAGVVAIEEIGVGIVKWVRREAEDGDRAEDGALGLIPSGQG
jgi:hypothetical protein